MWSIACFAAMFAHGGWRPGVVKATYGTGSSVMALGDCGDNPALCSVFGSSRMCDRIHAQLVCELDPERARIRK
jgi:hypothetical protein